MKKYLLVTGAVLLFAAAPLKADDAGAGSPYQSNEVSLDLFGTASIGQQTIDHLSGNRVRHDGRLGLGAGGSWFFTRYLGIEGEAYTENTHHSFVDDAALNLQARLPIGDTCVAPYGLIGAGRQFDPIRLWHWQVGAGVEFRLRPNIGLFLDGRYVMAEEGVNYGLGRLGVRIRF